VRGVECRFCVNNVVSFILFHERGFAALASRFMRALCYHYGVELHNFTPNTISQAASAKASWGSR
jgi:hypothetical protein